MSTQPGPLHPAIATYLNELEIAAKQCLGVHPNQILRDAREHLMRDCDALLGAEPGMTEQSLLEHFHETYGQPAEVAKSYEQFSGSVPSKIPALAPNWRIHCPRCGRSAPAAKVGITRIGARSIGKRVLGWCHSCNCLRWLSLTRDLNTAGTVRAEEEPGCISDDAGSGHHANYKFHFAGAMAYYIGAMAFVVVLTLGLPLELRLLSRAIPSLTQAAAPQLRPSSSLSPIDAGDWEVVSESKFTEQQLSQFSKKFDVPLKDLRNTVLRRQNKQLQVNSITTQSHKDAERLKALLRKGKSNPRWVTSNGATVFEFVVRNADDARLAAAARYAFPIEPSERTYHVAFEAVPIKDEKIGLAPDVRNRLFNLLMQAPSVSASAPEIEALSSGFTFADNAKFVRNLQGSITAEWQSSGASVTSSTTDPEAVDVRVTEPTTKFGLPTISLTADIHINANLKRRVEANTDRRLLLASTARFPSDTADVQQTVQQLIAPTDSDAIKLRKLLDWFANPQNIRYEGLTGARYGALTAFKQHFGRCWDYADLFITMARAAGLPARQVYGWLYESEGHVWCDVIVDGNWQMVDPTTGTVCGSDYVPLCASNTGEFPWIYASPVSITVP